MDEEVDVDDDLIMDVHDRDSSSDDDDDNVGWSLRLDGSGSEHEDVEEEVGGTKPAHSWKAIKELAAREVGSSHPMAFRQRYHGSLHVVQRLELMYKLEEHTGCVNAITFNSAGTQLASGSDDRFAVIWDWIRGRTLAKFDTGHTANVFQVKFLGGDEQVVTCSRDGNVRLATASPCGQFTTRQLASHTKSCHKLATLPGSPDTILSVGEDALVLSIDVRQSKATKLMFVKENAKKVSLYSIQASPAGGNEICLSGDDQYVRIYDRRKLPRDGVAPIKYSPKNFKSNTSSYYVTCAVFNYNGTEIIGSYNDDDIYLFDTKLPTGSDQIHHYHGHRNSQTVKGVNFFGPRSEFVISGSDCGNIYIWDKKTEKIVQFMRGDEDGIINYLEPHPHVPILATCGLDFDVKIWIPSCEHDPPMINLRKTLKMNKTNREMNYDAHRASFLNETLFRLWSQISRNSFVRQVIVPRDLRTNSPPENHDYSSSSSASVTSDDDNTMSRDMSPL